MALLRRLNCLQELYIAMRRPTDLVRKVEGLVGFLRLLHYTCKKLRQHHNKTLRYDTMPLRNITTPYQGNTILGNTLALLCLTSPKHYFTRLCITVTKRSFTAPSHSIASRNYAETRPDLTKPKPRFNHTIALTVLGQTMPNRCVTQRNQTVTKRY